MHTKIGSTHKYIAFYFYLSVLLGVQQRAEPSRLVFFSVFSFALFVDLFFILVFSVAHLYDHSTQARKTCRRVHKRALAEKQN